MPIDSSNANSPVDEPDFVVLEDPVSMAPAIDVNLILDVAMLSTIHRPAISGSLTASTDTSSTSGISSEAFVHRSNQFQVQFGKLANILDHSKRDVVLALHNLRDYADSQANLELSDSANDQSSCSTCQDLEKERMAENHLQIDRLTILMKILLSLAKSFEELIVKMIAGKVEILGVAEVYSSIKFMHKAMTDALGEISPSKKKEEDSSEESSSSGITLGKPVSDQLAELISSISEL